ncbi:hypothetical protein EYF80_021312 [Liparis tanakae]|uniref:Uncharacterized protein n=1 Tax=Liparis tanakae TaxID=230148 RepID=A0A4Z2HS43_9TELE|nr:hypothetical protein EYF80_021312 [Liparis tanakae]
MSPGKTKDEKEKPGLLLTRRSVYLDARLSSSGEHRLNRADRRPLTSDLSQRDQRPERGQSPGPDGLNHDTMHRHLRTDAAVVPGAPEHRRACPVAVTSPLGAPTLRLAERAWHLSYLPSHKQATVQHVPTLGLQLLDSSSWTPALGLQQYLITGQIPEAVLTHSRRGQSRSFTAISKMDPRACSRSQPEPRTSDRGGALAERRPETEPLACFRGEFMWLFAAWQPAAVLTADTAMRHFEHGELDQLPHCDVLTPSEHPKHRAGVFLSGGPTFRQCLKLYEGVLSQPSPCSSLRLQKSSARSYKKRCLCMGLKRASSFMRVGPFLWLIHTLKEPCINTRPSSQMSPCGGGGGRYAIYRDIGSRSEPQKSYSCNLVPRNLSRKKYLTLTCSGGVMTASYSMARRSGPELSIAGAASRNLSILVLLHQLIGQQIRSIITPRLGLKRGVERVTEVAKLVAALHDESRGVVVAGRQLVSVEDDDLSSRHHLLMEETRDENTKDTREEESINVDTLWSRRLPGPLAQTLCAG